MFSEGRDLELVRAQPLNFLVYPYSEVGGKPLAAGNVELQFAFEDVH